MVSKRSIATMGQKHVLPTCVRDVLDTTLVTMESGDPIRADTPQRAFQTRLFVPSSHMWQHSVAIVPYIIKC